MIAQAMVSICAFLIGPSIPKSVFWRSPVRCGSTGCACESTARLRNQQRSWSWNRIGHSDAHTDTPAQTMLSADDVAPKGARDATLILLREMQHCSDSMKPE